VKYRSSVSASSSVAVQWVVLLFHTQKMLGANLYGNFSVSGEFRVYPSSLSRYILWDSALKSATIHLLLLLS